MFLLTAVLFILITLCIVYNLTNFIQTRQIHLVAKYCNNVIVNNNQQKESDSQIIMRVN